MLGDGDFVGCVLASDEETMEKRYALQSRGFDLDRVASPGYRKCCASSRKRYGPIPSYTSSHKKRGKFSINPGLIRKIPLNPPLQKGEEVGMPRLIEMLQNEYITDGMAYGLHCMCQHGE